MDFDPFDHPFGGKTIIKYPKLTSYHLKHYKRGIFEQNSNICYHFGNSKHEMKPALKKIQL